MLSVKFCLSKTKMMTETLLPPPRTHTSAVKLPPPFCTRNISVLGWGTRLRFHLAKSEKFQVLLAILLCRVSLSSQGWKSAISVTSENMAWWGRSGSQPPLAFLLGIAQPLFSQGNTPTMWSWVFLEPLLDQIQVP